MIDLENEQLIPIREVPKRLPRRPSGRRLHVSTIYRWILRGSRGVRLEAIRIGGTTYTSIEALSRFAQRLSDFDARYDVQSPTEREKRAARAREEVERILYRRKDDNTGKDKKKAG